MNEHDIYLAYMRGELTRQEAIQAEVELSRMDYTERQNVCNYD